MADEAQRRWVDSMPVAYDRWLAPAVFRPFAVALAPRVLARRPGRVLELAAGTGVLTRELVAAAGAATSDDHQPQVTATDLNQAMVDFGRSGVPEATWQPADALDLPFDDASFDAIACQFGAMFFPDKAAAFAESRRVLAPDGWLVLAVWAALDTHEFEVAVTAALGRAFPDDPPSFLGAVPHGYADLDVVAADLRAGGFGTVSAETVTVEGEAASAGDLATGYCTGTPVRAEIEARGGDLDVTAAVIAAELEQRFGSGPIRGRMGAHLIEAAR